MGKQQVFDFKLPPVLYDVSGAGVIFNKSDAASNVPQFAGKTMVLQDERALRSHLFKCKNAAASTHDKHVNDYIYYTDGRIIISHRRMVIVMNPVKIADVARFEFKSGLPLNKMR